MFNKFVLCAALIFSFAQSMAAERSVLSVVNKSITQYTKKQFLEAIETLESIESSKEQYPQWHYYYAINLVRIKDYENAMSHLEEFVRRVDVSQTAKAYYYIGLIQFYNEDFDKALNSLELSLDVSEDPKLDKMTESLIDKTIRYQSYYDNTQKFNISFLAGYTADSNPIKLSADSLSENLNAHVLNYGFSTSYKVVNKYNFVVEPTLAVLDNYTLDSKLKANSTLQTGDALQVLLSVPFKFFNDNIPMANKYDISINAISMYLPVNSARELSLTSVYSKLLVSSILSDKHLIRYGGSLAYDQSHGVSSSDDDATGFRLNLQSTVDYLYSKDESKNLFWDIAAELANSAGINTKHSRYSTGVGYNFPSPYKTSSSLRFGYESLSYPDKSSPRSDQQLNLALNVSKELTDSSAVLLTGKYLSNSSNTDLYKYTDLAIGIQYTKSLGF